MMNKRIKILHLEDSLNDFELMHSMIECGGIEHDYFLTDTEEGFKEILESENIDIILSDYSLPDYNGSEALKFAREIYSPVPFIFVSGAIGEDTAIDAMLNGATDYVLKNRLERLVPAIKRALNESEIKILRNKAEIELWESQKMLNEAQKLAHIGVWNWEAESDAVTWTEELYQIAGLDSELPAPLYAEQSAIYSPKSWLLLKSAVENSLNTNESYELELEMIRPNGIIRNILAFGGTVVDKNGRLTGLYGTVQDITERKQAQKKLTLQGEIMKNISEGVVLIRYGDEVIVFTNPKFDEMFGYEPGEMIGKQISIVNAPTGISTHEIKQDIFNGIEKYGEWHGEILNRKKNSHHFWCYANVSKFDHPDFGTVLLAVHTNITERKEAEEKLLTVNKELAFQNKEKEKRAAELIVANRKLKKDEEKILAFNKKLEQRISERTAQVEAANKAKSEFLANMSHEIRTPMNAVLGYADLLGSLIKDKTQIEYIESIKTSGKGLLLLINGILDLSKIEAGRIELQYEYVNTRSFFSDFERIFSLRLSEKGLKFILDISSETPEGIFIDEARISQIILNLIGNAVKFTDKGSISLKVYTENLQVVEPEGKRTGEVTDLIIKVTDTGVGIPENMLEDVFKPFIQSQGQNIKKYGGTGLGLAISRRLLQLMNGTVGVDSKLNKGSTFTIKIPRISYLEHYEKRKSRVEFNPEIIVFNEAVVLIADDAESNRNYIRDTLKRTALKIYEAENGMEAFSLAKEIIPDLIITDISMPVLNGFELLDKLRSNKKLQNIPVIAYSASVMKDQKDHILVSKFAGLLIKPVLVSDLFHELMKNLKYTTISTSSGENIETEIDHSVEISDMSGMLHSLENHFNDICKSFEIIQPIDEVSDFGNQLAKMGRKHNSGIIARFGEEIVSAAESFNIDAILRLIRRYPEVISSLKEE
jgi:PAS domain S-box-containing protein